MRDTTRTTIAAAGLLAAAIVMGGCSISLDGAAPTPTVTATPTVTVTAGQTIPGPELARRVGDAMRAAGTGRATITASGSSSDVVMRYAGDTVEQHLTMPVESSEMDLVLLDGTLYVSGMPDQATRWIRLDPSGTDSMSRFFTTALRTAFTDPATLAKALRRTTATVADATAERTSYTVTVDPRSLIDGAVFGLDVTNLPCVATFVLDAQDRPITVSMTVGGQDVAVTYTDWGGPVDIEAPPPAEVGTFESPKVE